ncbi:MAG TPA: hypothetical protein VGR61_08210, partial [Candidatus Dormibacteraeota bacterium]|nr:hypothetical protein [Candidatus Dormibacteraeota bacterium]
MPTDTQLHVVESPGPYAYFVLSAFAVTLLGGPAIGVLLWLSRSGSALSNREEALVQAHGWTQLLGWAGLFVAGMSLRLLPRFAGRPERYPALSLALLAALLIGV